MPKVVNASRNVGRSSSGFLHGLTTLPLIGGGVTLNGNPTAVDLATTPVMLEAYSAWLYFEQICLHASFLPPNRHGQPSRAVPVDNDGAYFHDQKVEAYGDMNDPKAQHQAGLEVQRRADLFLSTVGCS